MADQKVSELTEILGAELQPDADFMLTSDMSALLSKKIKVSELMRVAAPYLSTVWDFATGSLLPTVDFTRASTGYRYNSAGLLVPETTDTPRFSFDPILLTSRGLLVEAAVTNNAQYSEDFSAAGWSRTASGITTDAAVAPDGTTTMDKLTEWATSNFHNTSRSINVTAGSTYAFSVFAKAGERTWLCLSFGATGFGSTSRAFFDLTNGVLGTVAAGITAFIQHVGSGIYRCTAIMTATLTAASNFNLELSPNGSSLNYVGDGTSGLFLWGANVNESDCATSYIQTAGANATRAIDVATITNSRALTDQCWVVKARTPRRIASGGSRVPFQVDDGTNNNRRLLRYDADNTLHFIVTAGGATQCNLNLGVVENDTDFSVAVRMAKNNFAASLNGGALVTDLSGIVPLGMTIARVGRSTANSAAWNSTIKYIETRRFATDAELVLLSQ